MEVHKISFFDIDKINFLISSFLATIMSILQDVAFIFTILHSRVLILYLNKNQLTSSLKMKELNGILELKQINSNSNIDVVYRNA